MVTLVIPQRIWSNEALPNKPCDYIPLLCLQVIDCGYLVRLADSYLYLFYILL